MANHAALPVEAASSGASTGGVSRAGRASSQGAPVLPALSADEIRILDEIVTAKLPTAKDRCEELDLPIHFGERCESLLSKYLVAKFPVGNKRRKAYQHLYEQQRDDWCYIAEARPRLSGYSWGSPMYKELEAELTLRCKRVEKIMTIMDSLFKDDET
ncbi:unnamed protein product [Amoebophrya sp. A120]|nr:unnamed protein product [Amoebophrya sp. A120]|eukprot:GSA120T00005683001.1